MVKDKVIADDRQILCLGLSDQHAIKRVSMRAEQGSGSNSMSRANGQFLEILSR